MSRAVIEQAEPDLRMFAPDRSMNSALAVPGAPEYETLLVQGIPVTNMSVDEAVADIVRMASEPQGHRVCFVDSRGIHRAGTDVDYREAVTTADRVWAGGEGFRLAGTVFGRTLKQAFGPCDLLPGLCDALRQCGLSLYLLGGKPGTADAIRQWIEPCFPGINIVGSHDGYFRPDDEPGVIDDVAGSQADVLLVGLGTPREDLWVADNLPDLGVRVAIGAAGLFESWSPGQPAARRFCVDDALFLYRACLGRLRP